jgi:hypothetical protein
MKHVIGLNLILGVWLLVLPFAFGHVTVAMWNDVVFGLVIISSSWGSAIGARVHTPTASGSGGPHRGETRPATSFTSPTSPGERPPKER